MPDSLAIQLKNVSKVYQLHGSQRDQLMYILGMEKIGLKPKAPHSEHFALKDVSLDVHKGHRIGIIGRNGAGKTTLLKLICGNFAPSEGTVVVNGTVQALMSMGTGFHPEYTGRENAEAALQYNGLARSEYDTAMEGIIEFCELEEYLDQPFKTYSLGMQARLMFATSTAIKPDILIIDEVLGAGDAYFIAKSKARVEHLVNSGCTMLLVSHSTQQVLELCSEAIWIDKGKIRMQGESFLVVKAYEEYLHGPIQQIRLPISGTDENEQSLLEDVSEGLIEDEPIVPDRSLSFPEDVIFQQPDFIPHNKNLTLDLTTDVNTTKFNFVAPGGISRWESEAGVKVCGFSIVTEQGLTNTLISMQPACFIISIVGELDGEFNCRYGIAFHDHLGICITRIWSPADVFKISRGEIRRVEIFLNPNQVGPGDYTIGISVLDNTPIEKINSAKRYDLLSRSFSMSVELPDTLSALDGAFMHSAEWSFSS